MTTAIGYETADAAYKARADQIKKQIARLRGLLKIHALRQKQHPRNWGYVGDLGSISEKLDGAMPTWSNPTCHQKMCNAEPFCCDPNGNVWCHDHAPESDFGPDECLDLHSGRPVDDDDEDPMDAATGFSSKGGAS